MDDTRLPAGNNPQTLALAGQLRRRAGSDVAFVQTALAFFRTGGFTYSLTPPPLGPDPIDDFLFHTRTGFCGHYASAFVDLMRAGGVPARVVTGYLGGQLNPYDGTLTVRQSDAHAWAEVWLADHGWTRVDPTAVVEPERLYRGILDLLPFGLSAPERLLHTWPLLNTALERWDALNGWWTDRVVGFNYRSQLALLGDLGFHSPELRDAAWVFAVHCWPGWRGSPGRSAEAPAPRHPTGSATHTRAYAANWPAQACRARPPRPPGLRRSSSSNTAPISPPMWVRYSSSTPPFVRPTLRLRARARCQSFERDVAHLSVPRIP